MVCRIDSPILCKALSELGLFAWSAVRPWANPPATELAHTVERHLHIRGSTHGAARPADSTRRPGVIPGGPPPRRRRGETVLRHPVSELVRSPMRSPGQKELKVLKHRSTAATVAAAAVALTMAAGLAISGGLASAATNTATLATTAGCGKAPTLTSGTHTIQSSGQNRSYILRIPANYDSNHPYRLIFGFHWLGGTANDVDSGGTDGYAWSYYGLRRSANNSTIFVAPAGHRQRLGQPRRPGRDLRRRHDQADRGRPVRRHHPALRHGLQLRRRHELRARLRPGDRLPRRRGLLRRPAQRLQRRHPADRLHRDPRPPGQRAQHLRRTIAA